MAKYGSFKYGALRYGTQKKTPLPAEYFNLVDKKYFEILQRETIYPVFRIELLDHHENVVGEITDDISGNGGSITVNYQSGVRRSCAVSFIDIYGELIPNANKGLFWIGSKFKLYIGLGDIHTGDIYWFSQGVYFINNPVALNSPSDKRVTISGVDKFGIFGPELGFNQLEGTYVIPAGTNAYAAIRGVLSLDFGNGEMIDPVEPILDITLKDIVLPYDINKSPGEYLSNILIEIADTLGADIYYNTDGRLVVSSGTIDPSYSNKAPLYDFTDVLPEYIESSLSYDYTKVVNTVRVVGVNIKAGINEYTAINTNPLSPTRVGLIPTKIKYVENSNISTIEQARDCAEYVLNKESIVALAIDFLCSFIPHLSEDGVITITDSHYGYDRQRFIIQGATIPLDTTTNMTVSATNIATLPYWEHQSG